MTLYDQIIKQQQQVARSEKSLAFETVSYTHLTLPTN